MTDVEPEIDRLFQLPLAEFTEARNALAARLKKEGGAALAARVKELTKPSATAWAVNQLHWTAPGDIDAVVSAGDRLRALQARSVAAAEHREAMRDRREAIAGAVRKAQRLLESSGHATSPAVLQRITATLEALAAYGSARPPEVRPGRLVADVAPPSLDALAALVTVPAVVAPPPVAKAKPAVRASVKRIEEELAQSRLRAEAARGAEAEAERRLEEARASLAEAERRVEKARDAVNDAAGVASRARVEANRAAEEQAAVERRLDEVRPDTDVG